MLATWRITKIFMVDDGPWNLTKKLRIKLDVQDDGQMLGFWDGLYDCVGCFSTWVGAMGTVVSIPYLFVTYHWALAVPLMLALPFALSAAAVLIEAVDTSLLPNYPMPEEITDED